MARIAPGLIAAVLTLLCAAPAAPAATKCKKPSKCAQAGHARGWHNGTYDGGPGDPIIAPVPVRARH